MKALVIIGSIMSLLFVSVVGHACESYEECMGIYVSDKCKKEPNDCFTLSLGPKKEESQELRTMKAIVFKLDEISKKMDNK